MTIDGVITKTLETHVDDRGSFLEVFKPDEMDLIIKQSSFSETNPGIIKAFHYHELQTDVWFFPNGHVRVALYDGRENSNTRGEKQQIILNEQNRAIVVIPPGVLHGYQVLGNRPAQILYYTTKEYDPEHPDEYRRPFNDPEIGFNWYIKNR